VPGGWYYAETGFAVRDEPAQPRFWTEFQRLGGAGALGLPTSRPYDAPGTDGQPARVQAFQQGWLAGAPGQPAAQRGEGPAPPAPPEALVREDRPEMAFVGRVDVLPRELRQGTTLLVRVWTQAAQSVTAVFDGRDYPLAQAGEAFVGLLGIHRAARLGQYPLRLTLVDGAGRHVVRNEAADTVRVLDAEFPIEHLEVDPKTLGLLDPVKLRQEDALLDGICSQWTPVRHWQGPFEPPVGAAAITSEFGVRRTINGGPPNWIHEGTDFDVQVGDAVFAAAKGVVVHAAPLYTRGNVIFVDHGWGVMTGYFHLSRFEVQVGQEVKKGQTIGLAGDTGFVTGPHLHVEVRVRNVMVEPLEWFNWAPFKRPDLAAL
jgi:hypothetical protein